MGWYFRKSINLGGGLRLNLSKSGVGASAGVRGLRFGVTPRGRQYVQCGMGGIYYRKTLGQQQPLTPNTFPSPVPIPSGGVGPQQVIQSANVQALTTSSMADLITELNRKHRKVRLLSWVPASLLIGTVVAAANQMEYLAVSLAIALILSIPLLWWLDKRRKQTQLQFDLDQAYSHQYDSFIAAFDQLSQTSRMWSIESEAIVFDRKYHAGASSSLNRKAITPKKAQLPFVVSNVRPPMLQAGRDKIYFFPSAAFVLQGNQIGAIVYPQLSAQHGTTRFIESESVPRDAQQVGTTWRFVNKSGGPDRRFANNRQIPIMEYGELKLSSPGGLNEQFHTSKASAASIFAAAIDRIGRFNASSAKPPTKSPASVLTHKPWPKV